MKFGLLLPHFGEHADRDKLLGGSKRAEELGFDSVWVRDHLVFEPHGEMEKPNRTFYDALTTLTAIGAVTERIELGTGSLIPFRHPLITALMAGTITQLVGPRLILGFGAGTYDHEFDAIGWGDKDRVELVRSNAEILRRVFTENDVSYSDTDFTFEHVTIEPKPVGGRIPFWYCGGTPAQPGWPRNSATAGCPAGSPWPPWPPASTPSATSPPHPENRCPPSRSSHRPRSKPPASRH